MNASPRPLASLDALRGCTMAAMLLVNDPATPAPHSPPVAPATK